MEKSESILDDNYDVAIIGASFSGLTLAHHLPKNIKVLVVEVKPEAGAHVESTGLITSHTKEVYASFFDIEKFITNPISSICVVAPGYKDYFVSKTEGHWIFQTDTKKLMREMAATLPDNVTVATSTAFSSAEIGVDGVESITVIQNGQKQIIKTKFLVGADGGHSTVAKIVGELDQNRDFLYGYEEVHLGTVNLGDNPAETIYHFWFGEFSLGYGGWLSPTIEDGKPAFRIGLAKLKKDRGDARGLLKQFMADLEKEGIISFDTEEKKSTYFFGGLIPVNNVREKVQYQNTLLIGDAAGFCGAFAADGIKGSLLSGIEAVPFIERYLNGNKESFNNTFKQSIQKHNKLLSYYTRQVRYRWVWDLMKRDRTFRAMYDIIEAEQDNFLDQFCDSKDRHRSLSRSVLKIKYLPKLIKYAFYILLDVILPKK